MGVTRFKQSKRYLKVSNIEEVKEEEMEMQSKDWRRKVDPLVTGFRSRCKQHVRVGRDVSIDEFLIQCWDEPSIPYKFRVKRQHETRKCTLHLNKATSSILSF